MLLYELFKDQELTEMPFLNNQVMPPSNSDWTTFFSNDTLARDFILMSEFAAQRRVVYINKGHDMAFIGEPGMRGADGKEGVHVLVTVEFKDSQILSHGNSPSLKGALQVDIVEAHNSRMVGSGDGTLLYVGLVNKGLSIISDNTQYRGGAGLWKKIAASQKQFGYVVNILVDGQVMADQSGKPVIYDGKNIPDSDLWSERPPARTRPSDPARQAAYDEQQKRYQNMPDKSMTLFVMRKA